MKMIIQIFVSLLLLYWPIASMFSLMAFDSPGSMDQIQPVILVLCIVFYPLVFGLAFYFFDAPFWGMSTKYFLALTFTLPLLFSLIFGLPKLLKNNIAGISSSGYVVKDGQAYFAGDKIVADSKTLETVGDFDNLAKDKDYVYYQGKVIKNLDPKTLQRVAADSELYFKDETHVIYKGQIVPSADPKSFIRVENTDGKPTSYFRDNHVVYYFGKPISGAIASSARAVGRNYLLDEHTVFWLDTPLKDADPATFNEIPCDQPYSKDKLHVYYQNFLMENADPQTFVCLDRSYSKDSKTVFYRQNRIDGADAPSFTVTGYDSKTDSDAKDTRALYLEGKRK